MGLRILSIALALLCGCGHALRSNQASLRQYVGRGDYGPAMSKLSEAKGTIYGEADRVVYWLNEGLLLHQLGQYEKSNEDLHQADSAAEDLYTKSISRIAASMVTNAMAQAYSPEEYERVLTFIYAAFNYLSQGNLNEAMVEIRRVNDKLAQFSSQYAGKDRYSQDGFAHWLGGILMEEEGSFQEALVSFRLAAEAYQTYQRHYGLQPPSYLGEDVVRAAKLAGQSDLARELSANHPNAGETFELRKEMGEIVLIGATGLIPEKEQLMVTCIADPKLPVPLCDFGLHQNAWRQNRLIVAPGLDVIKIAFPTMHPPPRPPNMLALKVANTTVAGQVSEDLTGIALRCLNDRIGREYAESIMRAITKYIAQKGASALAKKATGSSQLGGFVDLVGGVVNQATEAADTRSWFTLPAAFSVARSWVPPGEHEVSIEVRSASGALLREHVRRVTITKGKRTILMFRD
jgi:tetratricopeptide (TPR) repeat protein